MSQPEHISTIVKRVLGDPPTIYECQECKKEAKVVGISFISVLCHCLSCDKLFRIDTKSTIKKRRKKYTFGR